MMYYIALKLLEIVLNVYTHNNNNTLINQACEDICIRVCLFTIEVFKIYI